MTAVLALYNAYSSLILFSGVSALLGLSIYATLMTGQLSLGNAALAAIGGYAAAILTRNYHAPLAVALLSGSALAAAVAIVIGVPSLRLRGVYLAIATLAFGEVVRVVALNLKITGGALGLVGIPALATFWHVYGALLLTAFFFYRLERSRVGRAFAAIRQDETAAQASFAEAVNILTYAVFGGTATFLGPILGGIVLTVLPKALRFLREYRLMLNGAILVLVTIYLPRGILTPFLWRWRRARL